MREGTSPVGAAQLGCVVPTGLLFTAPSTHGLTPVARIVALATQLLPRRRRCRLAWRRIELGSIWLELELGARVEGLPEIFRIVNDRHHKQPVIAIGMFR